MDLIKINTLLKYVICTFLTASFLAGCKSYKAHLMFKYEDGHDFASIEAAASKAVRNYVIQPDDYIRIEVYTKEGERIIDPDLELNKDLGQNRTTTRPEPEYLIKGDGTVKLPMVGDQQLTGLTIDEASRALEEAYSSFFAEPFVIVEFTNKRVVVLGAPGGLVIPLRNENMSVVEIIALAGGVEQDSRANNIRLIRQEEVFLIDLSTIEGYLTTNLQVQAGDIIYIEPIPRVVTESATEISLIVSTITAFTTLLILILTIK